MIHQIIAVYDVKSACYARPVAVPADGAAIRSFQDAVNDKSTEYHKHPEDYAMFNIGTYDDQSGEITSSKPRQLAQAASLLDPTK